MFNVRGASLTTIAEVVQTQQHTSEEITNAYLSRIEELNPRLNAYLKVFDGEARESARVADKEIRDGNVRGPLHGVPIALKDIIDIQGHVTTAGGVLLDDGPAKQDAEVVARLREAGAVILGKLNLHEYAWGGSTDNPHFGRCFNPWKEGYSPGGSSGGSGAAVAANLCAAALGTDTLGSVRIPASFCGCVGIKPTAGRVSNRGVYPLSWSLDNVGPLASRVRDAAVMLNAMAGYDPGDPYSADRSFEAITLDAQPDIAGTRIGIPRAWIGDSDTPEGQEVIDAFDSAVDVLVDLGCERVEVDLSEFAEAGQVAVRITLADAAAIHKEHLKENADKIGADVRGLLEAGTNLSATDVSDAFHAARRIRHRVRSAMEQIDCVVTPTTPGPAHAFDTRSGSRVAQFTGAYNLLQFPAVSLPCGFTRAGLPIGLMIAAAPFAESTALNVACGYEDATPWTDRLPE